MKPLRIFRHISCEPPSYLCTFLTRFNIPFEIICLDEGIAVPDCLEDVSGLIFMGGAGTVNDPKDWILQELALIKKAEEHNIPVLGICFGAQLISKALGGTVQSGETMEIGWHNIESVPANKSNPWLTKLPTTFNAFHWHAHTFTVPPGATALWRSQCYEQQGFFKGRMLAMQFHMEMTADSVMTLSRRYNSDLSHPSECVQTVEQISKNITTHVEQLHQIADLIYHRWLIMTGLIKE